MKRIEVRPVHMLLICVWLFAVTVVNGELLAAYHKQQLALAEMRARIEAYGAVFDLADSNGVATLIIPQPDGTNGIAGYDIVRLPSEDIPNSTNASSNLWFYPSGPRGGAVVDMPGKTKA